MNAVETGQESEFCGDDDVYSVMADIALASQAPTEGRSILERRVRMTLIAPSHHRHITSQYHC